MSGVLRTLALLVAVALVILAAEAAIYADQGLGVSLVALAWGLSTVYALTNREGKT